MSEHPAYPSRERLRAESQASIILEDQRKAETAWLKLVAQFAADFRRLSFPLGLPVRGYDEAEVEGVITDWTTFAGATEDDAWDYVLGRAV